MRTLTACSLALVIALVGCSGDDGQSAPPSDQDSSTSGTDTSSPPSDDSAANDTSTTSDTNTTPSDTSVATDGTAPPADTRPADAPVATDGAGDTPGKCDGVTCPMGKVCCQSNGDCVNAPKPPGC